MFSTDTSNYASCINKTSHKDGSVENTMEIIYLAIKGSYMNAPQ